eukprot:scaffold19818_cov63-Phaeocystis_antarctica.AAC.4
MQHASGRRTAQISKVCTRCQPLCEWSSYLRSVEGPRATRWTKKNRPQSSRACGLARRVGRQGEEKCALVCPW